MLREKWQNHIIDVLVVKVPHEQPVLLCGRVRQALNYLKVYADETGRQTQLQKKFRAIRNQPQVTRKADERLCITGYSNVFRPGRRFFLGTPMHFEPVPNVRQVHAQVCRVPVGKPHESTIF